MSLSLQQIRHRWTGAVLFECELPPEVAAQPAGCQLGYAVRQAHKTGADLRYAELTGAVLEGADLTFAELTYADLTEAVLTRAVLRDADLRAASLRRADLTNADLTYAFLTFAHLERADLMNAVLTGAVLRDADLRGADLRRADLWFADLWFADLTYANLTDVNLTDALLTGVNLTLAHPLERVLVILEAQSGLADMSGADRTYENLMDAVRKERCAARAQRYRARNPDVPVIPNIDLQILDAINRGQGELRMDNWQTWQTADCLAGWGVTLAGEKGLALERAYGSTQIAARMIYTASSGLVPDFFASDSDALEYLYLRAAEQKALSAPSSEGQRTGGRGRS